MERVTRDMRDRRERHDRGRQHPRVKEAERTMRDREIECFLHDVVRSLSLSAPLHHSLRFPFPSLPRYTPDRFTSLRGEMGKE